MGKIKDRTNETRVNNNGERMVIIRYGNKKDIDVQFEDGTVVEHREYNDFKNGSIKNPYSPSVYGIGYMGIGNYSSTENGKETKCHKTWTHMLGRCYDPKFQEKHPTYKGCTVDKRWHNYQEYAKWHIENYYEIEGQIMTLDKDILCKGNKVYSAETCIFVPQFINSLFTKSNKIRGEYPIGVYKQGDKFKAQLNKGKDNQHLGTFNTAIEAFQAYKQAKETYVKELAEEYKDKIPCKLYEAMVAYEVEIDD